jgi:hypothetical protein
MFGVSLGIRVGNTNISGGGAFDSDAQAYFDRVSTAGGTLSTTEKNAVNQLVIDLKANSLWTPMKAIYPMVGASAAACAQNLKSSSFTGAFSSGWTFASTGVKGNGSNAEFVSNFALNNFATKDSVAFGLYSRTNLFGTGVGMTAKNNVEFYSYYNIGGLQISYLFDPNNNVASRASYLGLNSHSRTSSSQKYMQTKTTINSITSNVDATTLDGSIVKFAKTASGFDSNEYALFYISDGLNNTELLSLNTAVQAFQTTLSRNV